MNMDGTMNRWPLFAEVEAKFWNAQTCEQNVDLAAL